MGSARLKKKIFMADHPVCYYCGNSPSTTIDHVPSRECFLDGIGPEGYEFPACKSCNEKDSQIEQAVAWYIRMFDWSNIDFPERQILKLGRGVHNNNPELKPYMLRAIEKRKAIRQGRLVTGRISSIHDAPIVGFPSEGHVALRKFARKLVCALYYKHMGRPITRGHKITTAQLFFVETKTRDIVQKFSQLLPDFVLSRRVNTNIGNQFLYRYGLKDEDTEIFGFISQFSKALFMIGCATNSHQELNEDWISHSQDFDDATEAERLDV